MTQSEPAAHPDWPKYVKEITLGDISRLGVDAENQLYWNGHLVEVHRRLDLTFTQTLLAWITAIAVLIGAIATVPQGVDAGCKLYWWDCSPRAEVPATPPQPAPTPQPKPPAISPQPAPSVVASPAPAKAPRSPPHLIPGPNFQPR